MQEFKQKTTKCPECEETILTELNYVVWCQKCNWNLKYEDKTKVKTKWDEFYLKISKIESKNLFDIVLKEDLFNLKTSKLSLVAYLISVIIILVNLSLLGFGIYFLFVHWGGISNYLLAFVLLALFWLSKPKLRKNISDNFINKSKFPELYNLVNTVCDELKTSHVSGIILNEEFNASITEYGFSKKKVLTIGVPLWNVLDEDEKLYLLGHEIGHCVNGDPARGIVLYTAIKILIDTGSAIYPDKLVPKNLSLGFAYILMELGKYAVIPLNLLLRGLSHTLWFFADFLCHLIWFDSQRAEYLADLVATKINGKKSAICGMEKLALSEVIDFEVSQLALKNRKELDTINVFEELNKKVSKLPDHENKRLKRLLYFEEHRLDATHPPTGYRIKMLEAKGLDLGNFDKSKIAFDKIKNEICKIETEIQYQLIDSYKSRLYY